jgi:hypothetical protein
MKATLLILCIVLTPLVAFSQEATPISSIDVIEAGFDRLDEMIDNLEKSNKAAASEIAALRLEVQGLRNLTVDQGAIINAIQAEKARIDGFYDAQLKYISTLQKYRNGATYGFAIGGISLGVGVPCIVSGIQRDNRALTTVGGVTIGLGAAVYAVGHFVFSWF